MLHQLSEMLSKQEYHRCVDVAHLLLSVGGHNSYEVAQIHLVLCRSYLALSDYTRAIEAGRSALDAAESTGDSGLIAGALAELGVAQAGGRRFTEAQESFDHYWEMGADPASQGRVLYTIAGIHRRLGEFSAAAAGYTRAMEWHVQANDEQTAQQCRHEAISAYLEAGQTDAVLPLLAGGDVYVQGHPEDTPTAVTHCLDWAAFLYLEGEYQKSIQVAFGALEVTGDLTRQARAHLLLSQGAQALDKPVDALSFAMAARIAAIDAQRYDLEFEAADILFRLLRLHGADLLQELDREFLNQGVDLYQYISEDWYHRLRRSH